MNFTTSPKIWAHRNFLTVVHKANEMIEREAGAKSEALAVYWGLVAAEDTSEFTLQVTVVDAASPQTPFHFRRCNRRASSAASVSAVVRRVGTERPLAVAPRYGIEIGLPKH